MTDMERISELTAVVLDVHKDQIGTHYPGCWKYHVACLAYVINEELTKGEK